MNGPILDPMELHQMHFSKDEPREVLLVSEEMEPARNFAACGGEYDLRVHIASDLTAARKHFVAFRPDLILLDVFLTEEPCQHVRREIVATQPKNPAPALYTSFHAGNEDDLAQLLEVSRNRIAVENFTMHAFWDRVAAMLVRHGREWESMLIRQVETYMEEFRENRHALTQPLTALLGQLQILLSKVDEDFSERHRVEICYESALRLRRLIDQSSIAGRAVEQYFKTTIYVIQSETEKAAQEDLDPTT